MKVLIVDQFDMNPYWLQQNPTKFEALHEALLASYDAVKAKYPHTLSRRPVVQEVAEGYSPEMCTTILREGVDGLAEVWKYRWDSSG